MSDTDSSSENHSSSECSTDSSDDDRLETIFLCGTRLQIPQGLCEKREIFDEFFSPQTWNSLSESNKHHLRQFLPTFHENDDQNKNVTLQRIFNGEEFKFSSPLDNFYEHLKAGHYRPDIAKMRYLIRKAERKESMWRYKRFREQLQSELVESRQRLLNQVNNLPPGIEPRLNKTPLVTNVNPIMQRTKRRYFQILANVRSKVEESGFSSDENFPEGAPAAIPRKQKRHLNTLKNSHVLNGEKIIISTMSTRPNGLDLEKSISSSHNPFSINEQMYKQLLKQHRKRKLDNSDNEELDTKGRTIQDIINRSKLNYNKKFNKPEIKVVKKKIKKEPVIEAVPEMHYSSDSDSEPTQEPLIPVILSKPKVKKVIKNMSPKSTIPQEIIKVEEKVETIKPNYVNKITPATLSDLDGIDMMTIPIDLEDSNIDILDINSKAELMQDTHANFLALIRDIICSTTEHRMGMDVLEERLKSWQENPITALNDWYCLADNWVSELQSAINFLSGNSPEQPEDFVPYIEYKPSLNVFQWIGAGRDSDNLLAPLFQYWLDHKNEMKPVISIKDRDDVDLDVLDRSLTPPLSRCPTNWTVRKADSEEIRNYREQERRRYDNPHKAFTYRCNGYESVVGPIKGVYNSPIGNTKARGHTMLSADRPNFVTILSLVRDAAARLPNGEGTRAEICELLKSSQYISSTAPDNVLQSVVSGALDRMHTQFDPCVKYDPKRKIWIYLHRNRTEEDFERIHQQFQGMSKNMKRPQKIKTPTKPKPKAEKTVKTNTKTDSSEKPSKSTVAQQESKQTSLLINQNIVKQEITNHEDQKKIIKQPIKQVHRLSQEEKEINEALQSIVQQNNTIKTKNSKSVVKIISSNQDKSLIVPPSTSSTIKQETRVVTSKISQTPITTQQLIQTLAQQKQVNPQQLIRVEIPETSKDGKKTGINIQQQILQGISPQQLQSLKNVTLLRNMRHSSPQSTSPQTIVLTDESAQQSVVTISDTPDEVIKVQQPQLTLSQQQQIIQSIRQKGLSNLATQQQVLIRHKAPLLQKNVHATPGTSLLGQTRVVTDTVTTKPLMAGNQGPLVAKVLTNAAGQVISVESLLAHQKQHGALPQGTTLRVSGVKGGPNIIQLAAPSMKGTSLGQVAVGQSNFITLSNQPKLVLSSTPSSTTSVTSVKSVSKPSVKSQTISKFTPKVAQQIINAKFITQNVDTQKLVQPKVILGQNQIKLTNKNVQPTKVSFSQANTNSIRMVNTANINLAHLRGNPVLLASKGSTLQNIQGQNVIIQTQANTVETGGLVAINSTKNTISHSQNANVNVINQGQVVLAPQIKMQPQMLLSSNIKNSGVIQGQATSSGQIIVGGHPVRLQSSNANAQRVVLASQGQGGQFVAQQILLPAGFQGTAINIKSLQGVKVIPIAQTQQAKGVQGRQVFARVMNPSSIVRTTIVPSTEMTNTTPTTE